MKRMNIPVVEDTYKIGVKMLNYMRSDSYNNIKADYMISDLCSFDCIVKRFITKVEDYGIYAIRVYRCKRSSRCSFRTPESTITMGRLFEYLLHRLEVDMDPVGTLNVGYLCRDNINIPTRNPSLMWM